MSDLKRAVEAADIKISRYSPEKQRPVATNIGTMDVKKFTKILMEKLGPKLVDHPAIVKVAFDTHGMSVLLEEFTKSEGLEVTEDKAILVPEELQKYTLNIDKSSKEENSKRFFLTTDEELVSEGVSGRYYLDRCRIQTHDAVELARDVVPRYMPRRPRGITVEENKVTLEKINYYNTYIPPDWLQWKIRNPKAWAKLPAKPPVLVMKLLKHLIPLEEERKYLYAWLYTSLKSRSYVYLVLCGTPGAGKNRLKLLISALHGMSNSADGKKETFGANDNKFNGQMEENTLIWYDELKISPDMEPRLKEYQNDRISIERKGIDATKSTEIYPSMVISNNYPRDNYLPFDARKFAPLVLADRDLRFSMSTDEISELSDKIDAGKPDYDVAYVAQIAKWIETIGSKNLGKWPHLEYRGPKFWEITHASMPRWQKIAVLAASSQNSRGPMPGWNQDKGGFLWSKMEEALRRKKEYESKDYRDATTVRAFFDAFRDEKGNKVFETESVGKSANAFYDFWVKPLGELKTISKMSLYESIEKGEEKKSSAKETPKPIMPNGKLTRPVGISDFKWRKMQEEYERDFKLPMKAEGSSDGKKTTTKEKH